MNIGLSPRWRAAALDARALAFGIIVGVALVTAYVFIDAQLGELAAAAAGQSLLAPVDAQILFAALYSSVAAVLVAATCLPIWIVLRRYDVAGWRAAAALGFVATLAFWIVPHLQGESVSTLARDGLVWAVCGAVAGVATWWASRRSRAHFR